MPFLLALYVLHNVFICIHCLRSFAWDDDCCNTTLTDSINQGEQPQACSARLQLPTVHREAICHPSLIKDIKKLRWRPHQPAINTAGHLQLQCGKSRIFKPPGSRVSRGAVSHRSRQIRRTPGRSEEQLGFVLFLVQMEKLIGGGLRLLLRSVCTQS
jgi:hypothetical protein